MSTPSRSRSSLANFLALNRTVAIVLLSVLCFGLGEQLWERFIPVFLQARLKEAVRGTSSLDQLTIRPLLWTVGIYSCLRNLFEGFCYLGGGHLTARLGDRGSLLVFGVLTVAGYVLFLTWSTPAGAVVAALLILGWEPLSVPVTFTTVGATVSDAGRGMAFALQSIQKRLPKILGPMIAGRVLTRAQQLHGAEQGTVQAMLWLVSAALGLGLVSLVLQWRFMPNHQPPDSTHSVRDILRGMHPTLRRLLLAEVFKRWCDWLVRDFIILYVVFVRKLSLQQFGDFVALQNTISLLTYLPIGRLTRTVGLQPFIGFTFIFFALFPLALAWLPDGDWLLLAFIIQGLREVGEPARKALITSLLTPEVRARGVGLYWGVRAFAICTASLAGAGIWLASGPQMLLYAAFACGCIGAALFYLLCRTR